MTKWPVRLLRRGEDMTMQIPSNSLLLQSGIVRNKYRLRQQLGAGCFGEVWRGHDPMLDCEVAIKILKDVASDRDWISEAIIGNSLDHRCLVKVINAEQIDYQDRKYILIVMKYYPAGSIIRDISTDMFLPLPDVIRYTIDILTALEYLHHRNILHGDIKPANILKGENGQAVLTDYGLSHRLSLGSSVSPNIFYETHAAPEVMQSSSVSIQSEIFQVGMTALRLLNGLDVMEKRLQKLSVDERTQVLHEGKVFQGSNYQPFVPRTLKSILNRAVRVCPSERFSCANDMRVALERLHFPGYWTKSQSGDWIGFNGKYLYRCEHLCTKGGKVHFTAMKTNQQTCNTTKISQYSARNITKDAASKLRRKYMQFVVTG